MLNLTHKSLANGQLFVHKLDTSGFFRWISSTASALRKTTFEKEFSKLLSQQQAKLTSTTKQTVLIHRS